MSDGEPGRMTNPTPPVVRLVVVLLAEAACTFLELLYDMAVEVNVADLAGLKRRALELS
jgi:hypothetical protein